MKIVFLPEVLDYFNELTTILYEQEYFGFEESALAYVDELIDNIKGSLHIKLSRKVPAYFNKYGKDIQYAIFRKNKKTQWFVFFTIYKNSNELIYLEFVYKVGFLVQNVRGRGISFAGNEEFTGVNDCFQQKK